MGFLYVVGYRGNLAVYQKCCGGVPHDDRMHKCCEDDLGISWDLIKRKKGRNYSCCTYSNGLIKVIDTAIEKCPDIRICGGKKYNPDQHLCCQGNRVLEPN